MYLSLLSFVPPPSRLPASVFAEVETPECSFQDTASQVAAIGACFGFFGGVGGRRRGKGGLTVFHVRTLPVLLMLCACFHRVPLLCVFFSDLSGCVTTASLVSFMPVLVFE